MAKLTKAELVAALAALSITVSEDDYTRDALAQMLEDAQTAPKADEAAPEGVVESQAVTMGDAHKMIEQAEQMDAEGVEIILTSNARIGGALHTKDTKLTVDSSIAQDLIEQGAAIPTLDVVEAV